MSPEFDPRKSKIKRPLEPLPNLTRARQDDLELAPQILRTLEIGAPDGLGVLTVPQNFKIELPSLRARNAASHLRLRAAERALLRIEGDIKELSRAHRLPSLIDKLAPTRAHEIIRQIDAVVRPAAYGALIGVLPVIGSYTISNAAAVRALGALGGLCCAIVGVIGASEAFKQQRTMHATALHPRAAVRRFLVDLQRDGQSVHMRRGAIATRIESLQQRSMKVVRAREQIEQKMLWPK